MSATSGDSVSVEHADPDGPEVRKILAEYEADIRRRYPGGGAWEGTGGRKDALWLAREPSTGAALGCVAARRLDPDRIEVKHLYVVPAARRRGIAGRLMDALEADAGVRGAVLLLETGTPQPEAIAFYERRGYAPRGPYPGCEFETERTRYFERSP